MSYVPGSQFHIKDSVPFVSEIDELKTHLFPCPGSLPRPKSARLSEEILKIEFGNLQSNVAALASHCCDDVVTLLFHVPTSPTATANILVQCSDDVTTSTL